MEITVLAVADCPHVALTRERIASALLRVGRRAQTKERVVSTNEDAARLGFRGSPTILIDGTDPFPADGKPALACRLYPTERGMQGAPTVDQLIEALAR
jgi:hypothetical protein